MEGKNILKIREFPACLVFVFIGFSSIELSLPTSVPVLSGGRDASSRLGGKALCSLAWRDQATFQAMASIL
jgi:hypothetical protein